MVRKLPSNGGDADSIPGSGTVPAGGNSNPLQYSCLGKSNGERSLEGHSPWGREDMTLWLRSGRRPEDPSESQAGNFRGERGSWRVRRGNKPKRGWLGKCLQLRVSASQKGREESQHPSVPGRVNQGQPGCLWTAE